MISVTIDNLKIEVEEGTTLLEAARRRGIHIPTLCNHPAVEPYGACRLCLVEAGTGDRMRLVTSCTYPAREGLQVTTDSGRVQKARRFIIELLLARCPDSSELRETARRLGVESSRFPSPEKPANCILCGLCVRVCGELVGAAAIGFINRGIARAVETPFHETSGACIGCGACVFVCPTGAVDVREGDRERRFETWHTGIERARCAECGAPFATVEALARVKKALELPGELLALCGKCRRKKAGMDLVSTGE